MAQRAGGHGFPAKTAVGLLIGARQQQLERHRLPLHLIVGTVDCRYPAAAQLLTDEITPDLLTGQGCQASTTGLPAVLRFVKG